jgi:hypothetical protein
MSKIIHTRCFSIRANRRYPIVVVLTGTQRRLKGLDGKMIPLTRQRQFSSRPCY